MGIIILWDRRIWNAELVQDGRQCITGRFSGVSGGFNRYITAVYANCNRVARRVLWGELIKLKNNIAGPWVVCGDVSWYPSERATTSHRLTSVRVEFFSCIENLEMVDPPLLRGYFTWRRREENSCASRMTDFFTVWKGGMGGGNYNRISKDCF